jgi:transposase-like protein
MVPQVSRDEIQPLIKERLATEAVIKTDGWQGYSFLDASPHYQHEWLVPGSGKEAPKVLPWVHTLIATIKGNIRSIHHGVSPKHLPRYLGEFCYRFNRRF